MSYTIPLKKKAVGAGCGLKASTLEGRPKVGDTMPSIIFDLGAGERNCVSCAYLMAPVSDWHGDVSTGHRCARWVDTMTNTPISCHEARTISDACGAEAVTYTAAPAAAAPTAAKFEAEVIMDRTVSAGPCTLCAHYFARTEYAGALGSGTSAHCCARFVDGRGAPVAAERIREDETLCGPVGQFFQPKEGAESNGTNVAPYFDFDVGGLTHW